MRINLNSEEEVKETLLSFIAEEKLTGTVKHNGNIAFVYKDSYFTLTGGTGCGIVSVHQANKPVRFVPITELLEEEL